jgi:hypothetical protein
MRFDRQLVAIDGQIYDDVTEKMFGHPAPMREDESPEGLIVHSAGQGEQGYYVYDVWESREAFERFMEEKLGPALAEVMGGPPPESGAPRRRRSGWACCPISPDAVLLSHDQHPDNLDRASREYLTRRRRADRAARGSLPDAHEQARGGGRPDPRHAADRSAPL